MEKPGLRVVKQLAHGTAVNRWNLHQAFSAVPGTSEVCNKMLVTILNGKLGLRWESPGCKSTILVSVLELSLLDLPIPEETSYQLWWHHCASKCSMCFHVLACVHVLQPKIQGTLNMGLLGSLQWGRSISQGTTGIPVEGGRRDLRIWARESGDLGQV